MTNLLDMDADILEMITIEYSLRTHTILELLNILDVLIGHLADLTE